jgi:ribonuclease P protein component
VPRTDEKASPVQAGFSVPKKKFRSSVHRHRIRRLMVEAWRLNKHTLYEAIALNQQIRLFLIFTDNKMPDYEPVKEAVVKGVEKLIMIVKKEKNHE